MQADAARIIGIFERRIWKDPSNCIYLLETIRRGWSVSWDLRRYFPAIDGNQSHSWEELLLILLSFLETADSEGDVAPHSHSEFTLDRGCSIRELVHDVIGRLCTLFKTLISRLSMEEVLKERFERNEFWNPVNVETFWILELILELFQL